MSRHRITSAVVGAPRFARRPELSQHFLRDRRLARSIARELRAPRGSIVLDAGAGDGALTEALADAGFRVIAVEKDVRLFRSLRERFIGRTNIECHHADVLEFPWPRVPHAVVSNVPYAISAALVRRIIASAATEAVLVLQREAAQKFAGVPRETLFSLVHKPWLDITLLRALRRRDFNPPPAVDSVLLRMHRREVPLVAGRDRDAWCAFVSARFGSASMREALRATHGRLEVARLERELQFSRRDRPSWLTFEQWLALFTSRARVRLVRSQGAEAAAFRSACLNRGGRGRPRPRR